MAATTVLDESTLTTASMAELIPSLPLETRWPPFPQRRYRGFWLPEAILRVGVPALHSRFEPRPTDILLASSVKCGTTWLKALAFATVHRATHSPFDGEHPLLRRNPHECVQFLEHAYAFADGGSTATAQADIHNLQPPRVLATHLPFSLLPDRITTGRHIVYICREPKDAFVSWWCFNAMKMAAAGGAQPTFPFEEAFELFCQGRSDLGPQWAHVLEYWKESIARPSEVLFLKYEEMLRDPAGDLKRLAEFLGCPFSEAEQEAGVVDAILELCSLDRQKNLEVNKSGTDGKGVWKNKWFFRKGIAGDWSNHMTPELAAKLDKIVEEALQGSGFTFASSK